MLERILTIILPVLGGRAGLALPALASKDFDMGANRMLLVGSIGVVLGSGLLAWPFARLMHADARRFVPPMMFNHCGNMGLPLAALAYGAAGFSPMVALFTIPNVLHFTLGIWIIDHHARVREPAAQPDGDFDGARVRVRLDAPAAAGIAVRVVLIGNLLSLVFVPIGLGIALRG